MGANLRDFELVVAAINRVQQVIKAKIKPANKLDKKTRLCLRTAEPRPELGWCLSASPWRGNSAASQSKRSGQLLTLRDEDERWEVHIKQLYDLRSSLVHGASQYSMIWSPRKLMGASGGLFEVPDGRLVLDALSGGEISAENSS